MKQKILYTILIVGCISINAQKSFVFKSKDNKVLAENFISYDGVRDSVIIKNKNHKFLFSHHKPFINIKDNEGYDLIDNSLAILNIKKVKRKIYLIIGYAGNTSVETQLNLFFIKKNKILKYYVIQSNDKMLRDVSFEYLPKNKEVVIPVSKKYTPQNYLYDIELKKRKSYDTIKPITKKRSDSLFYHYKLKIK